MPYGVGSGSTQVPALQAFSALKLRVQRYVHLPSDTEGDTVAGEEINDAIRELNTRTWYWALAYSDITLVAGTSAYNLPTNFKAARNLQYLDTSNNANGTLSYMDPKTFDAMYPVVSSSGTPATYTCYSQIDVLQLNLDTAPTAAVVAVKPKLRLRYHARVPVLSQTTDTAPVPSEVELFIMWKARAGMALQYEPQKYQLAENKAALIWQALVRDNSENHWRDWTV